jgi:hypothetical protein
MATFSPNHLSEKYVKFLIFCYEFVQKKLLNFFNYSVATFIATWGVFCTSLMTVTVSSFIEISQQEHKVINLYQKVGHVF